MHQIVWILPSMMGFYYLQTSLWQFELIRRFQHLEDYFIVLKFDSIILHQSSSNARLVPTFKV